MLSVGLLLCCLVGAQASSYCYNTDLNPNRNYVEKTPYIPPEDATNVKYPRGCKPVQLWTLQRHASRYIKEPEMEVMEPFLHQLRDDIMANLDQSELCQEDVDRIRSWTMQMQPESHVKISDSGWDELIEMGQRFAINFPRLVKGGYTGNDTFEFRHTNYTGNGDRTLDSSKALAQGLFGRYEGVEFTEQSAPDFLLFYFGYCQRYLEEVVFQPEVEWELFKTADYTLAMIDRLEKRLGLSPGYFSFDDLLVLYSACRAEYDVYGYAAWCAAFDSEAIDIMEYGYDVRFYWRELYGNEINYEQTCAVMQDLYYNMIPVIGKENAKTILSRDAHSPNIITLLARLGLYEDPEPLYTADYEKNKDRLWRFTTRAQMSSNINFVLYECKRGKYKVQMYHNEELVAIPGCSKNCPFEDFDRIYGSIAKSCDIQEICSVDN